jgi:putative ABC transport system substrate-binding protein
MRRRDFLTLVGGAAAAPFFAHAQEVGRTHRIGILNQFPRSAAHLRVFFDEMRRAGFIEGRTLDVIGHFATSYDRYGALAADMIKAKVEAIVCGGGGPAIRAVQAVTRTLAILGPADDMVAEELVSSLVKPGGNVTGISILAPELDGKRQEILIELVPGARRMAALYDPRVTSPQQFRALQDATRTRGVELLVHAVSEPGQIVPAIEAAKAFGVGALNVMAAWIFSANRKRIAERTAALRLPTIFQWPEYAEEGGLIAYGPSQSHVYRQLARITAKVLRGANPAELPVEQPTHFELVINLDAAKAIGLTVPTNLLSRADKVI